MHLLSVWNPAYADDAMTLHASLLRYLVHEARQQDQWDGAYVWWGKVRSSQRQQPMPHLGQILGLGQALLGPEPPETHLYLTDYRSLYVAEVGAISEHNPDASDPRHTPPYYQRDRLDCDCWFMLLDIRRLVADDLHGVIEQLQMLSNVRYHGKPVSLYGGMVELPLLVTRADTRTFFSAEEQEALTEGRKWVEFDAETGGLGAMERDLRENLFGDRTWSALDPSSRTFMAVAEKVFRDHRHEAGFDFGPVVTNLSKALEVEVNRALRTTMTGAPAAVRFYNQEGQSVDLAGSAHLSLKDLAHAINGERERMDFLRKKLGRWFAEQLPPVLDDLRHARNPGAHSAAVGRELAVRWRNRISGVGELSVVGQVVGNGR